MKKTYIWRGLCTLLVLVFSLTMFGQSLAFTREGDVNLFLGTLPPAVQVTGDTNYYPSSYASMDEMRAALKDHLIESQEEGSVLLRNENGALPLAPNASVTLFGFAAATPVYHGGSGGPPNEGINLYDAMKEEAQYQFLLHDKYLCDKVSGLWYHGWSFLEKNNFAGAFWGRGNCWITMAIPEFFSISQCGGPVKRLLQNTLQAQIQSLKECQAENGMWHTLVDDADSYVEASATCGFAYGILKAVKDGLVDKSYLEVAAKAAVPILDYISEDGVVNQVSYGTPMGRTTKDFYKEIELRPMPYGQALAILFLMEYRWML